MSDLIRETLVSKIVPGMVGAATKSTSPIKRWLQVRNIPQAVSIVFGRVFEEGLNDLIEKSEYYEAITNSSDKTFITPDCQLTTASKGNKDIDILFRRDNTVFYREVKCNLLLDSEKSKSTANKVNLITSRLQKLYPACYIDSAILNMEWDGKKTDMHGVRVEYIGEFMNRLGVHDISKKEWLDIGKVIGYSYKEGVDGRQDDTLI